MRKNTRLLPTLFPIALSIAILTSLTDCAAPDQPAATTEGATGLRFQIQLAEEAAEGIAALGLETPVTGRVFVIVSRDDEHEPRNQIRVNGVPFWGRDVRDLAGGGIVTLASGEATIRGFPLENLADLPADDYFVQALLSVYTTFQRADGHTVRTSQRPTLRRQYHLDDPPGKLYGYVLPGQRRLPAPGFSGCCG